MTAFGVKADIGWYVAINLSTQFYIPAAAKPIREV